jgi:hypothetical protein
MMSDRPTIDQTLLTVIAKPRQTPVDRALADAGRFGRRRHRPRL